MNQYYTEVGLEKYEWKLGYSDKILFMGSCFTENIGDIMHGLKFQTNINPFGIVYNPKSIALSLQRLMAKQLYQASDLFEQNDYWGSFDFHGRYSGPSAEEALTGMNRQVEKGHQFLQQADYLVLTFGTAWAFELKQTGQTVANCHKFQATDFMRYRLTPGEIVEEFKELLSALWKFNPNLKILFTVSPIRHLKDGANGNQLSKSTLLLAIDRLITGFGKERCAYFPSYEIVMDELRDYRFYAADLVHLSPVAIEHIWTKFKSCFFNAETNKIMAEIEKITKSMNHRPLKKESYGYVNFLNQNLEKLRGLTINFPYLNLRNEIEHFEKEMNGCK